MKPLAQAELTIQRQREDYAMLQKRLSARREENMALKKELFRAQESARIANEAANDAEQKLADTEFAYDCLRNVVIQQSDTIEEFENMTLWQRIEDWFARKIKATAQTEGEYYNFRRNSLDARA